MKLEMREEDGWCVIDRTDVERRAWMEKTADGAFGFQTSTRISDADVEGTLDEMRAIALAIQLRGKESFKRCAVDATKEEVHFWSPRNSQRHGIVPRDVADALAAQILAEALP